MWGGYVEGKEFLKVLCEGHAPSGREHWLHEEVKKAFRFCDENSVDNLNNLYVRKDGNGKGKIMLSAHLDEVFLMVNGIKESGFLSFIIKGIDRKALVSQEVIIHGKKDILGIIGIKPPHLMNEEERNRGVRLDELFIDTGYSKERLEKIVSIGDFITIKRNFIGLLNDNVACKALDNRASVASLYYCARQLENQEHDLDVYFVFSAQEEVGARGVTVASNSLSPTIGIAIDTTFDSGKLGDKERELVLGDGPVISIGPNIHPKLRKKIIDIAKNNGMPYQVEVEPGNTGTDAWYIQISRDGIPTLLISIPIKYMHTSVEVANLNDIKNTGRLLAEFIASLKFKELEELLCF